jgi:hypothetical protein
MSETPYYDAYMRGERSKDSEYKKSLESLMNYDAYNFFQNIIGTYSEDLRYDD